MKKKLIILSLMVLFLVGCFHAKEKSNKQAEVNIKQKSLRTQDSNVESQKQIVPKVEITSVVENIKIEARKYEFSPSTIIVKAGSTVKMKIKSVDVDHGISLPDFGISEKLIPGEIVEFEFVADKRGTFNFFCNIYCGAGHTDMSGRLIVQ